TETEPATTCASLFASPRMTAMVTGIGGTRAPGRLTVRGSFMTKLTLEQYRMLLVGKLARLDKVSPFGLEPQIGIIGEVIYVNQDNRVIFSFKGKIHRNYFGDGWTLTTWDGVTYDHST